MKLGYETAPHTARGNYREASSSASPSPEPWPEILRVLLADEPTGNLDFRTGEMIIALLEDLHRSHKLTSIYVTHNLSFAARCDRILQLDKGSLTHWTGDGLPGIAPPDGARWNIR